MQHGGKLQPEADRGDPGSVLPSVNVAHLRFCSLAGHPGGLQKERNRRDGREMKAESQGEYFKWRGLGEYVPFRHSQLFACQSRRYLARLTRLVH